MTKDYKIVTDKDTSKVEKEVNKLLKKGYDLRGDLIHSIDHTTSTPVPLFTQVVTYSEPVKEQVKPDVPGNDIASVAPEIAKLHPDIEKKIDKIVDEVLSTKPESKKKSPQTLGKPDFYVQMIGGHAFVEIMEPTGKVNKFTLMNCKTPPEKVKVIIQNMFFANKLNRDNLHRISGIEFTSIGTER